MNNFDAEICPQFDQESLGLIVIGHNALEKQSLDYFQLNYLLDGLLSQRDQTVAHQDVFFTRQFNQHVFLLFVQDKGIGDLKRLLHKSIEALKPVSDKQKNVLVYQLKKAEVKTSALEDIAQELKKYGLTLVS